MGQNILKGCLRMKEWFSDNKKTITLIGMICLLIVLCVWIIFGIINGSIIASIKEFFSIIAPIVIGFVIAYLCNPVVSFFENTIFKKIKKIGVKRVLSIILTFIIIILILSILLIQIIPNFISAVASLWQTYIINYKNSIKSLADTINNIISDFSFLDSVFDPIDPNKIILWIEEEFEFVKEFDSSDIDNPQYSNILSAISKDNIWSAIGYIFSIGTSVVNGLKNFLLGFFISFYMLLSKEKAKAYTRRFLNAFLSPKKVRSVIRFGKLLDRSFGGFIEGQIVDAFVVGVISYFVFLISGMPSPYVLATIVAITNIIPILGPIIGAVPCAFLVLLIEPSKTILFILLIIIIQQIDGNIICPKILGGKIKISSLSVITSIVIMGGLFGIPGMIIGVPVFAVAIHLLQNWTINRLRNKGLDTSIEQYYVGNAEEVVDVEDNSNKVVVRIYNWIVKLLKTIWINVSKLFKKKKK